MTTQILLLRGVNVGGHHRLAMEDLRQIAIACGASAARTYRQSGNLVVQGEVEAGALAHAIERVHGFRPVIIARHLDQWRDMIAGNPFSDLSDPRTMHVFFLAEPAELQASTLRQGAGEGEELHVTPEHVYLLSPAGISGSKIAPRIEARAGCPTTARNWRSVTALGEMAEAL